MSSFRELFRAAEAPLRDGRDAELRVARRAARPHGPAGMGHYYGKYGFDMLTHAKSMLISPPDVAIDHLFPPYSPEKNAELKLWFEY